MVKASAFLGPSFGLILILYATYCMLQGGSYVKGKGWMTKEEAPKTYIVNMCLVLILGGLMVLTPLVKMAFE